MSSGRVTAAKCVVCTGVKASGQSCGHIVFHAAGDAGIARHLSAQAHEFMSRFVMAETLRGLNELQKVGRLQLGDRLSANDRENRIFQIAAQFFWRAFRRASAHTWRTTPAPQTQKVSRSSRSLASFSSLACFFFRRGQFPLWQAIPWRHHADGGHLSAKPPDTRQSSTVSAYPQICRQAATICCRWPSHAGTARPPPSESFCTLPLALAFRTAASESFMLVSSKTVRKCAAKTRKIYLYPSEFKEDL